MWANACKSISNNVTIVQLSKIIEAKLLTHLEHTHADIGSSKNDLYKL